MPLACSLGERKAFDNKTSGNVYECLRETTEKQREKEKEKAEN